MILNNNQEEMKLFIPSNKSGLIAVGNQDLKPNTIEIGGCEHIYLTQSGIDVKFKLNNDNIKKFKKM